MWIFISCIQYPGTRYLIGRSRLSVLKRTTLKTMVDIIKNNGFENKVNFNAQTNTFRFNNGSEIMLIDLFSYPGDPDYDRLGSLEITGAFIDELSEISYKGFEVLFTRIRYKLREYNLTPKLFCASNPTRGWSKNFFYRPYMDRTLPEHVDFIPALPSDNPYLPDGYLSGLERTLGLRLKQRLVFGSWDFDTDDYDLFDFEKIQQAFYNEYFINLDDKRYLTCDIGDLGNDKTVIGLWVGWNLTSLFTLSKNETTQVVEKIRQLMVEYKVPINQVIVDSVGVGAGVASLLKGCVRYGGGERALHNEKYRNIKTQLMYKFAEKINNNEVNFNMPYNDNLVQEMLSYKKTFTNEIAGITTKDEIKRMLGRSPDIIDSLYLRAFWEFKRSSSFTMI